MNANASDHNTMDIAGNSNVKPSVSHQKKNQSKNPKYIIGTLVGMAYEDKLHIAEIKAASSGDEISMSFMLRERVIIRSSSALTVAEL